MDITKQQLNDFYQEEGKTLQGELYEKAPHAQRRMETLKKMMSRYIDNSTVLDLGCADGVYTKWISEKAYFVVGMDISKPKIDRCPKLDNGLFVLEDWDNLHFKENSFNVILLTECIEHSIKPRELVENCFKISKVLIGSLPLHENLSKNPLTKQGNGHLSVYDKEKIYSLFDGYKIKEYIEDVDHAYFVVTS